MEHTQANHKRILVVDDEPHICSVLALKLGSAGYEVLTAGDGQEGYTACIEEMPDLLITDHSMPYLSGIELCQKLKENPETAHIPALLLTARGMGLASRSLEGTNVLAVVTKPFSPRELLSKVGIVLDGKGDAGSDA